MARNFAAALERIIESDSDLDCTLAWLHERAYNLNAAVNNILGAGGSKQFVISCGVSDHASNVLHSAAHTYWRDWIRNYISLTIVRLDGTQDMRNHELPCPGALDAPADPNEWYAPLDKLIDFLELKAQDIAPPIVSVKVVAVDTGSTTIIRRG